MVEPIPIELLATASDRHADFCLWPYEPLTPVAGKLRSEAVLWAATRLDPQGEALITVIRALQAELGRGQTVWGLKQADGRLSYELYFYDYARTGRQVSVERVLACLKPFVPSALAIPGERPYFMFSIDLDPAGIVAGRPIEEISIYFGNPSSDLSSGLSYRLTAAGLEFANLYHFFHTRDQAEALRQKLVTSAHFDDAAAVADRLLAPEGLGVVTVIANKRQSDGIYYSRVRAPQMADFLGRHGYPTLLRDFVTANLNRLDHLYFDLGLDYAMIGGELKVRKTAIYGFA